MKQISAAMFLTAALSLGVSAFAQTTPTNPTGQVDPPTGQAAPQKPVDLKDVPAGHWAQEAIKIAADCGIIRGYPDGTFRGNQPITRYEAAAIVARLLAAVKSGACGIGTNGTSGFMITEEQWNDVQSAIQELQADLAQLGVRVAELEDNAVTQDDLARVEELATQARDIAEQAATTADDAAAAAADAADAAAAAQEAADAAQAAADENADAIQAAQDAADAAQEAADAAQASADDALDFIGTITVSDGGEASVDLDTLATVDDIAGLQDQIDALQEALDGMEPAEGFDPTELQGQLDDLTGTVDDLQSQIDDLNAQIADMGATTPEGEVFDPTDLQDQIDDLQAQIADTQDQISALTDAVNAQQETIDGLVDAVAGTQDDIGTLQDVTADLQAQIDALAGVEGADPQAMQDLMDAIDAASIAADTALAQSRELQDKVDELDGRVTDLESGLGELGATVESQADSIAALNDLVVLLNQDVLSLQDRVTQLERQVEELSGAEPVEPGVDLTDDLDSLREFTTLLRRDQTALADTVGDLEARVGALETKVDTGLAALDKRVSTLENNGFTVAGTISLNYYTARVWNSNGSGFAQDFDIDRLGIGSFLSTGADDNDSSSGYADFGVGRAAVGANGATNLSNVVTAPATTSPLQDRVRVEGFIQPGITLTFTFKPRALTEASGGFNVFSISLGLELVTKTPYTNPSGADNVNPVTLKLTSLATRFDIGGAPLVFSYGVNPSFKFTNYGFNNTTDGNGRGDGFVARLDGSGLLPFNAKLTAAYGSTFGKDNKFQYFVGINGTLEIIPGLTGGVYYGYEGQDVFQNFPNTTSTLVGLNATGKVFGFLDLDAEYNVGLDGPVKGQVATYVKAGLGFDPFSIKLNARTITAGFTADAGIGNATGPFNPNQTGFGVQVGVASLFGFLSLDAFFDTMSRVSAGTALPEGPDAIGLLDKFGVKTPSAGATSRQAFGVKAGLTVVGFTISPYFLSYSETAGTINGSGFGVDVKGSLFSLVNLAAGYQSRSGTLPAPASDLYVYGELDIAFGDIKIKPKGWFETQTGAAATDTGFGVTASTPFLFGSSLAVNAALDNTDSAGVKSGTGLFSVSLNWTSFLLPNSSFKVEFGSRLDTNRNGKKFGPSFASPKGLGSFGADGTGTSYTISGLAFQFSYYGLVFNYGIFSYLNLNIAGTPNVWGQEFGIKYSLKF